jgi:hypothetical protein
MQAVNEWATETGRRTKNHEKKLKKLLKNLLTNGRECDIMCFTSALNGVWEHDLKKVEKNLKKF